MSGIGPAGAGRAVLLDACVLYPTVMRELLLGVAAAGLFRPLWSARILEEWARAAARAGLQDAARAEIALCRARWPAAEVASGAADPVPAGAAALPWLPDPDDRHVLGSALAGRAELIVTMNLRDFPRRVLGEYGICAEHPDSFLHGCALQAPEPVAAVAARVRAQAERLSGEGWRPRRLMKKARLPRFGRWLESRAPDPGAPDPGGQG